jgi:hypothetical protein
MAVTIQGSQTIDRPVSIVFHFYADEHVRNHPRWDPDIHLENPSGEPLRVGTLLKRQNTRSGTLVEGSMQVVEFERDRLIGMLIHDGPAEMRGRAVFESTEGNRTRITVSVDIPAMDAGADTSFIKGRLQHSVDTLKRLIESEL